MQSAAVRSARVSGNKIIYNCNTTVVYFITPIVTVPISFSSQMASNSQQKNTTLSLMLLTPSECIAWLSVFGIEVAAMVALNALEIIFLIRNPVFASATCTW